MRCNIAARPLLAMLAGLIFSGCGGKPNNEPPARKIMVVDTATGESMEVDAIKEFPGVHPVTGKRTLMPGLYCRKCKKWHPAPPPDRINRIPGAANCPQCRQPLTVDGL